MAQLGQSFIGGIQAGQSARAGRLAMTQQQAEIARFLDRQNLESTVKGALQFRNITDPAQQDAFLRQRISEIEQRGGDPRDTVELLNTPSAQRQGVVQNLINIGERFGVITRDPKTQQIEFGQPRAGVTPTGEQAFFQTSPTGETRRVEGFAPIPKEGETIETLPGGGVRISRGVQPSGTLAKPVIQDLQKTIISNEQNINKLDRIGELYKPQFLTYGGKISSIKNKMKSKAGFKLSEKERQFLGQRRKFTQNVNQFFNKYRKEITGAGASIKELEDLKNSMLNEDLAPDEFAAAFDEFRSELLRANRLTRRILREGVSKSFGKDLDSLFKAGEDDDIEARGNELRGKNLSDEQIVEQLEKEGF